MRFVLADDRAEARFARPSLVSLAKQAGLIHNRIWLAEMSWPG